MIVKNQTSCRIKAKEKTSTLVSYPLFLKTSGATYRPIMTNSLIENVFTILCDEENKFMD